MARWLEVLLGACALTLATGDRAVGPRAALPVSPPDVRGSFVEGARPLPAPALRHFAGARLSQAPRQTGESLIVFGPLPGQAFGGKDLPRFAWAEPEDARYFRIEIADRKGEVIYTAVEPVSSRRHVTGASLRARAGKQLLRWRIVALSAAFEETGATPWTEFRLK